MALYLLLRHVHSLAAAAMVVFVVVMVAVGYLNDLNLYIALTVATGAGYAQAAGEALVPLFIDAHRGGFVMNELFSGLWLVPLGYLVLASRQFPRVVGVLLLVTAVNWISQFFVNLLAPGLPYTRV